MELWQRVEGLHLPMVNKGWHGTFLDERAGYYIVYEERTQENPGCPKPGDTPQLHRQWQIYAWNSRPKV
jgi:hypothetical protein